MADLLWFCLRFAPRPKGHSRQAISQHIHILGVTALVM